jgi:hypothetical protein
LRLHDLRHTCVSLLLAQGVHPRIVMEIVGHSAIEMTMNVYGHVNLDTQRNALDNLDVGLRPWQFIAILSGRVPEQRKVPLTWENVGVEANILL